ncbi:MAG: hypothetical protein WC603_00695 [Candidatus Paceibacterota bacterium]|jgi:hypothetical protein
MSKIFTKTNKNNGYAILFTVIIISAISALTAGLASTVYKQLVLSSLVKNSQSAFYQADTAADCALYGEFYLGAMNPNFFLENEKWICGGKDLIIKPTGDPLGSYDLEPELAESTDPCFRISVRKILPVDTETAGVEIRARGYNICDINNPRVVEREIEINY